MPLLECGRQVKTESVARGKTPLREVFLQFCKRLSNYKVFSTPRDLKKKRSLPWSSPLIILNVIWAFDPVSASVALTWTTDWPTAAFSDMVALAKNLEKSFFKNKTKSRRVAYIHSGLMNKRWSCSNQEKKWGKFQTLRVRHPNEKEKWTTEAWGKKRDGAMLIKHCWKVHI